MNYFHSVEVDFIQYYRTGDRALLIPCAIREMDGRDGCVFSWVVVWRAWQYCEDDISINIITRARQRGVIKGGKKKKKKWCTSAWQ